MDNKIKIKRISVSNLSNMIKKMSSMTTEAYLNIGSEQFSSSVYTPTRDVVKYISFPLNDVMEPDKPIEQEIKLSFFNASRVISALSHFDPHLLQAEIHTFIEDGVCYASKINLKDKKLRIELECQDMSFGFTSMTDDQLGRAFNEATKITEFELTKEMMTDAMSLLKDESGEMMTIEIDELGVHFKGQKFDLIVDDNIVSNEVISKTTFKTFLDKLDKENYKVVVCEFKLLFYSNDTNTKMMLNTAVTD